MRPLASALAFLLLVASVATAAPQRSSNLGVRVTVVRSCAIKTSSSQAGASVTCSAGQIAPVITTAVVPAPPAAPAPAPQSGTTTVSASTTATAPATARPAVNTPAPNAPTVASTGTDDDAADDADAESTPDTVRVVTINF